MNRRGLVLLFLAAVPLAGQDEFRVSSPNGNLEFRLGIAQPEPGSLSRLAYQVFYQGKKLIDVSYLGLDIRDQEPLLGENLGLIGSKRSREAEYSSLVAEYMQNGSLGRRLDIDVRVANDGVAFRYVIPRSTPLQKILIDNELTEFDLTSEPPGSSRLDLPLIVQQPGAGWIGIDESAADPYPRAYLEHADKDVLMLRLPREDQFHPGFVGTTPLTGPWRIIAVGGSREAVRHSAIFRVLGR